MKNIMNFAVVVIMVVIFSSCAQAAGGKILTSVEKTEVKAEASAPASAPSVRTSTVRRTIQMDGRQVTVFAVYLEDGVKIAKDHPHYPVKAPDKFFFLKEGDTVRYTFGEKEEIKVIEIRFKSDAQ